MINIQNFIGGEFSVPQGGSYIDSFEPATGKVFCKVPDSDERDVDAAYKAASSAFPSWSALSAQERSNAMLKVADLLEGRLDEFAAAESRDNGKPVWLATAVDIPRAVLNFRFFATAILHHEDMSTTIPGGVNYTLSQPVGVAGLISPWNLPLYLLTWKIAPAIACGNTVVAKPSEITSLTAWMLCSVLRDAGIPPGVVNMVFGRGGSAGASIVKHPKIPLISFTGGTATGELIVKGAAPFFKKVSLELGGKNPNVIFDDADLDEAITTTLRSSFANQGEICLCGSRIFVQRPVYDEFLHRFIKAIQQVKVGDPKDPSSKMGALVSADHRDKVLSYIELAKEEGGTIETGGIAPSFDGELSGGYWVAPTVITGLGPSCRVQREEIFGPVVTVYPFDTEEEAIELANSVEYGLSASIWTGSVKRAHNVAAALNAGTVWVNTWLKRDLRVPFGGAGHSGVGREGGKFSIDFFTEQKTVCIGGL